MRYTNIKRTFKSPFYVNFKNHFCPDCNEKLSKVKVSRIVNSKSEEAKDFNFHFVEGYMIGNVKFIWTEFQCPNCNRQITIDEMKQIEKSLRHKTSRRRSSVK